MSYQIAIVDFNLDTLKVSINVSDGNSYEVMGFLDEKCNEKESNYEYTNKLYKKIYPDGEVGFVINKIKKDVEPDLLYVAREWLVKNGYKFECVNKINQIYQEFYIKED